MNTRLSSLMIAMLLASLSFTTVAAGTSLSKNSFFSLQKEILKDPSGDPSRRMFFSVQGDVFEYYNEDEAYTDMLNKLVEKQDPQALAVKAFACCYAALDTKGTVHHQFKEHQPYLAGFRPALPEEALGKFGLLTLYVFARDIENGIHVDRERYVDLHTYTRLFDYVHRGIKYGQSENQLEVIFNNWAQHEANLPFNYQEYRSALQVQKTTRLAYARSPDANAELVELTSELRLDHSIPAVQARLSDFRKIIDCIDVSVEYYCRYWQERDYYKSRAPLSLPGIHFN